MPTYDEMLSNPEYFRDKKNAAFTIMHMSPDEYIEQAYQSFKEHGALAIWQDRSDLRKSRTDSLITKYAERMGKGDKFPLPVLDFRGKAGFSGAKEKSFTQEGLHRAYAAKEAGVAQMPVMVVDDAK